MTRFANEQLPAIATPAELRASSNALVRQFIGATQDGPVRFHYPAPSDDDDYGEKGAWRGARSGKGTR